MSNCRLSTFIACVFLALTACAAVENFLTPEMQYIYQVKRADYERAFHNAERALMIMGFKIVRSNKESGEIHGGRRLGRGLIEDSGVSVLIKKKEGNIYFELYVESTADREQIIDRFVEEYSNYVRVIPLFEKNTKKE